MNNSPSSGISTSSTVPRRYQRNRKRGGEKPPPDSIYVGRPTKWGNPFKISRNLTRAEAIERYERRLLSMSSAEREGFLAPLRAKNLVCWCPLNVECHADVLLKWAN